MTFDYAAIRKQHGAQIAARAWYAKTRGEAGTPAVVTSLRQFYAMVAEMYSGPGAPAVDDPMGSFDPLLMLRLYPETNPVEASARAFPGLTRDWPAVLRASAPEALEFLHAVIDTKAARDALDNPHAKVWEGDRANFEAWHEFDLSLTPGDMAAIFLLLKGRVPMASLKSEEEAAKGEPESYEDQIARGVADALTPKQRSE